MHLFLWGVVAACVAMVVYVIPRGLDITDESLYVLLAQAEPTFNISVIHTQLLFKIASSLFGIEWGIKELRVARFIFMTAACWFLGRVLGKEIDDKHIAQLMPWFCANMGFLQYAGIGHIHTLGYNSINWISAVILTAVTIRWNQTKNLWHLPLMALMIFSSWISKFSASVLLAGLALALFPLLSSRIPLQSWFKAMAIFVATFFTLLLFAASPDHPILPLDILHFVQNDTDTSHTTNRFLLNNVIWQIIIQYGWILPSLTLGWIARKYSLDRHNTTVLHFLTLSLIITPMFDLMTGSSNTGNHYHQAFWIAAGSLMGYLIPQCQDRWKLTLGFMMLLVPMALTLGTNQPWLFHLLPLSFFPICGSLVLGAPRTVMLAGIAAPIFMASNMVIHPYRQAPLMHCTQPIHIPTTNDSILVTPTVHKYLKAHKTLAEDYPYPLLGTDRNCGEILMTTTPTCSQILWSKMQWNPRHLASWNQHDTLLFGLCNTDELGFFQNELDDFGWTPIRSIERGALLTETKRWDASVPASRSEVHYFLLTKTPQ